MADGNLIFEPGGHLVKETGGHLIHYENAPASCPYDSATTVVISWTGYCWDSASPSNTRLNYSPVSSISKSNRCLWAYGVPSGNLIAVHILHDGTDWACRMWWFYAWPSGFWTAIKAEKTTGATPVGKYTVVERNYVGITAPYYNTVDNIEVTSIS